MTRKVIEVEADSIEDAINQGLKRLDLDRSETDIEILRDPDLELFEAVARPARVRLFAQGVDLLETLRTVLQTLLQKMGLSDFQVDVSIEGEFYYANIESDRNLRVVMGRCGETLNALQHLAERMLNRVSDRPQEVIVDADNYRERREQELIEQANEVSSRVLEANHEIELEPMIGVERKIIHETVQDNEGVKSHSIGEETNRRVVILPRGQS